MILSKMYSTVSIFAVLSLMRISVCIDFCESDNTGLNKCHDGGCNSRENTSQICVCDFSKNLMTGKYCGVYVNKCLTNPCKNNGMCQSGIGHHICECSGNFYGVNCEIPIKEDDTFQQIRKLSLFYRIKSTQGEELHLLLVSDTFGNKRYNIIIESALQNFGFKLDKLKEKIKIPDLIKLCSDKLSSKEFIVNKCNGPDNNDCQDMCNLIPKIYGNDNEVEFALIGPYFNTKTTLSKKDIFIDLNKKKKIGRKYNLEIQLYSTNKTNTEYKIPFIHFIADDELSHCLPYIEPVMYQGKQRNIITLKRKVQWTLDTLVSLDNSSLCALPNNVVNHTIEWKIFNAIKHIPNYHNEKGESYLDDSMMHNESYIIIDSFKLPMGIHVFYLSISINDNVKNKRSSNQHLQYIETELDGLVANIKGPPTIRVDDTFLTLDASDSYNPNEKDGKKNLLYTWECNIEKDEICTEFTTTEPQWTLNKTLELSEFYQFTLTLSVDDNYIQSIGYPENGITYKVVHIPIKFNIPKEITKKLIIECLKNCKPLSNPSSDIHLEVKIHFIGQKLEWYYQKFNITTNLINSVNEIALTDVPNHMLIVKKNMLHYGTTYKFSVMGKDAKYKFEGETYITTISKPKIGICTIFPKFGLAGKTLFTIACKNFKNDDNTDNIFEYYQKNKNDETSIGESQYCVPLHKIKIKRLCSQPNVIIISISIKGVLLTRGNGTMSNFKLTSSKYLTVKVINKYGASVHVNLTVDVTECNPDLMTNLFKELKTTSRNNDISRSVSIISILSDLLHENHINKFNQLFEVLAQIPIKNSIFNSLQLILILQKVIKNYYEVTNGKMGINEILKISTQILQVSDSLYEYIKISNEHDKIIEIDKVEQIKEDLQKYFALFQSNQFNITKPKNPSERHFWSSTDNLIIITKITEDFLKSFGKSTILELTPYERLIVCDEEVVIACILSREWIKNKTFQTKSNAFLNDVINREFGKELLSKGNDWGLTMFNVKNNLIQPFDKIDDPDLNYQITSLDISRIDQNNELIEYNKFEKSIQLNFKINNTKARNYKNYTIWIPSKNCSNLEFDKTIFVYRIDMINIKYLFVSLSDSTHDLRFTWLNNKRPDIEIMNNNTYAINITAGEKYEFILKTLSKHQNNIHYIGISANMDKNYITKTYMPNVNFSMYMFIPQCLYWSGKEWSPKGLFLGPQTTENNIHCETSHVSLFSGLILTLPNITDPIEEINHFETISNNKICLILVTVLFIIYTILLVWSIYQDKKDVLRGEIIILHDNYPGEDEVYLITVYTGNSFEAGTTANVCIQLHGNMGTSRAHWLHSYDNDVLQRFNDDWFIIFTPKSLGDLQYIHIWHDNYGNKPDWYCKHIEVTDVRGKRKWNFNVERWFSLSSTIDNIKQFIYVGNPQNWKRQVTDEMELTIREDHQWASVFIRHPRSLTTRSQRLSKIMCLLLSVMLISLIFYEFNENDEEQFLTFEITLEQVSISIQSSVIQVLMTFGISYCFNKSKDFQKVVVVENQVLIQNNNNNETNKTWWRKILLVFVRKKLYLPAQTEKKFKTTTKINFWLIAGWALCIFVYVMSSILIIGYGLKLGLVKSLHWLMTIIITIIQNAFLVEPLQIIISSCVVFKFHKNQNIITIYQIKLANYRRNTSKQLQNVQLIRSIRESRNKYVYNPLCPLDAQYLKNKQDDKMRFKNFKYNATTCLMTILTSLFCIGALHSFESPKHIINTNNINKLFLKNQLQNNTMDLEMLKKFLTKSLIGRLHIKEYHNGIPIAKPSQTNINEENIRGWFNLYNSKLINGGIRLTQNRIRADNWKNDVGYYKKGWTQITEMEDITPWTYRSIPTIKYFGLWFPNTHNSGFMLDLTGGLVEYKKKLNTYLNNGWLDNRTRNLVVEFQTYTPNVDCITMFKIQFQTTSGLVYIVNNAVSSVPSSSVFITPATYVFTLVFTFTFTVMAIRLLSSVLFMVHYHDVSAGGCCERFWLAYECTLLVTVLCTTFALTGRWHLMVQTDKLYENLKEMEYLASIVNMCRAHGHITALVALVGAMALVRVFRLTTNRKRIPRAKRTLGSAGGGPVTVIAAYASMVAFGAWYCTALMAGDRQFLNTFVLARNAFDRSIP